MKTGNAYVRVIAKICLLLLIVVMGALSHYGYLVSHHLSRLELHLQTYDAEAARVELNNVRYLYGQTFRLGLDFLASRYIFRDLEIYQARYDYLIGDYEKIKSSLASSRDYRAAHLVGTAKFRQKQSEYKAAKDKETKNKIVEEVIRDINPDFRRALENSPAFGYLDPNFDDRWNYDITSDPESAARALAGEGPPKRILLGFGTEPAKGKDGPSRLNEEKMPGGSPDPQRKG